MRPATLEFLRCPYCGGRLELVTSLFHERDGDEILHGILGCHCCIFPVVDGIPVLHLQPAATRAREEIEAGRPAIARRAMFEIERNDDAAAFDAAAASTSATFRETVEALGANFEGGYFLYRFSDPTYLVAQAVARSVARVALAGGGRAIDMCGGSGHLTRSLIGVSAEPPVLADLYYAKVWLARRFTAPGCEPVCCDANTAFPFARGAFAFAMCTDALMYLWTKRQFVSEMERLVSDAASGFNRTARSGTIVIGHTHNERVWSPSHGQALSVQAYRDLFESLPPRAFAEALLFADVVKGGPLDLSRVHEDADLERDPALTLVASADPAVFARHELDPIAPPVAQGEYRLNPLYAAEPQGDRVRLRLQFPSQDYEQEYGACREYLPAEVVVDRDALAALPARTAGGPVADLARRRIVLDLPRRYY